MGKKGKRKVQHTHSSTCCSEACDHATDKDVIMACQRIFERKSIKRHLVQFAMCVYTYDLFILKCCSTNNFLKLISMRGNYNKRVTIWPNKHAGKYIIFDKK